VLRNRIAAAVQAPDDYSKIACSKQVDRSNEDPISKGSVSRTTVVDQTSLFGPVMKELRGPEEN
jgi:hypothetical protein